MDRRQVSDRETRLLLLRTLKTLGPATGLQLTQFMAEYDVMGYFELHLNLGALEDEGQVRVSPHPLGPLYTLTQEGLFTLESFEKRIPQSRRQLLDEHGAAWAERFRLEQDAPVRMRMLAGRRLALEMSLMDGGEETLNILLILPVATAGDDLQERWQRAAGKVYSEIALGLGEGYTADEEPASLPESAALAQRADGTVLLKLSLDDRPPEMMVSLRLTDPLLARHWAARWPERAEGLRGTVTDALGVADDRKNEKIQIPQ